MKHPNIIQLRGTVDFGHPEHMLLMDVRDMKQKLHECLGCSRDDGLSGYEYAISAHRPAFQVSCCGL
jgi:hypothetical protein